MSEQIPPPPKKVVSRNVAIGLGIICIILVVALGVVAFMDNSLQSIVSLQDSAVWVNDQTVSQGAGSVNTWIFEASRAGYVVVEVLSSTVSGTHVEVIWNAYGVSFDQTQVISVGNVAVFPLLPCYDITVGVGNGLLIGSANETVTIIYCY
jgi:hypothetical protein